MNGHTVPVNRIRLKVSLQRHSVNPFPFHSEPYETLYHQDQPATLVLSGPRRLCCGGQGQRVRWREQKKKKKEIQRAGGGTVSGKPNLGVDGAPQHSGEINLTGGASAPDERRGWRSRSGEKGWMKSGPTRMELWSQYVCGSMKRKKKWMEGMRRRSRGRGQSGDSKTDGRVSGTRKVGTLKKTSWYW